MDQPKASWYSLHKDQIKLIQFLLYHLRKNKEKKVEPENKIQIKKEEIVVTFD